MNPTKTPPGVEYRSCPTAACAASPPIVGVRDDAARPAAPAQAPASEAPAVTVRYGRIGSDGQARTKQLADEAAALRHVDDLIREKTAKGYVGG